MITKYVNDLANQMNILLPLKATTVDGSELGCLGVHLLNISFDSGETSVLMYQSELDDLRNNVHCDRLE